MLPFFLTYLYRYSRADVFIASSTAGCEFEAVNL